MLHMVIDSIEIGGMILSFYIHLTVGVFLLTLSMMTSFKYVYILCATVYVILLCVNSTSNEFQCIHINWL